MTAESREIAAMVDLFPSDIRPRLRDALLRIAEIYVLSGVSIAPANATRTQMTAPSNLLPFPGR
jgi:hypothetical protein